MAHDNKKSGSAAQGGQTGAKNWPSGAENAGAGRIGKGGSPLPDGLRESMESLMNADFSDVRILNNSCVPNTIGAKAYTHGTDIHFASGQYNPTSADGRELLGHELTHVVQQMQGRVKTKP